MVVNNKDAVDSVESSWRGELDKEFVFVYVFVCVCVCVREREGACWDSTMCVCLSKD